MPGRAFRSAEHRFGPRSRPRTMGNDHVERLGFRLVCKRLRAAKTRETSEPRRDLRSSREETT